MMCLRVFEHVYRCLKKRRPPKLVVLGEFADADVAGFQKVLAQHLDVVGERVVSVDD